MEPATASATAAASIAFGVFKDSFHSWWRPL